MASHVASLHARTTAACHVACPRHFTAERDAYTDASAARQVCNTTRSRCCLIRSSSRHVSADVSSALGAHSSPQSSDCRRVLSQSQFFGGKCGSLAASAGPKKHSWTNVKTPRGKLRVRALGQFLTDGNVRHIYDRETLNKYLEEAGNKLVVLDVSAKICGPCKLIYPKIVKMSEEYTDAVFLKIEGDHDTNTRALMREWGVKSVPCFRFFRNGEMIHTHTGAREEVLKEHFFKHYQGATTDSNSKTKDEIKTG
eukprot:TRINITY_DN225_c0_g1_i1.p1 TRINITY_DN225_c0_g1~~TRINITY_DN225_c0_g1_i1.p1  ORF type:complete len:269 (-),score=21.83 TRINITY_DN225_c0_g1_i1:248-1009(-)